MSVTVILPPLPEHAWLVVPLTVAVHLVYSPDADRDRGELAQCDWFSACEVPKSTTMPHHVHDYIRTHVPEIETAAEHNLIRTAKSKCCPPVPVTVRCCNGACRKELDAIELMGSTGEHVQRSIGWDHEKQVIMRYVDYAFSCPDKALCCAATRMEFQHHTRRLRLTNTEAVFRRTCVVCGRRDGVGGERFLRCGACHVTCYCGNACKNKDWPFHQTWCAAMVEQKKKLPKRCLYCSRRETAEAPLKHCARCHWATYCNTTCQRKDWPEHKHDCQSSE